MVPTTFSPKERTVSTASAVVQCSRTILRLGYLETRARSVGRNLDSAFMTVTPSAGLLGTSPCRLRTMPSSSMALRTSWKGSKERTPHSELVVAPLG